jgi:TolB-like protein/class 3 adenylate cyclase
MNPGRAERRLAAILAADVAGYSRLMGADEEGTLAALKAIRRELGDPKIAEHRGRIVKTTGDGLLVEFASVVDAVRCAAEVQRGMALRDAALPEGKRIEFRIGVNLGDIILDDGDIFGDGVNIAARLEALAEPGGICLGGAAHEQVRDKLDLAFEDVGEQQVKNISRPIRVYRVRPQGALPTPPPRSPDQVRGGEGSARIPGPSPGTRVGAEPAPALTDKPSIAVLPFQNMSGDPEQEYFADGMVEEIITALSRIRWFFVVARNSSFTYKGQAVDVKQVGRELGVRYVLEGSVRKGGNRVRITAQLIDAETGAHLWADRFDGSLEDVFELQDKVAASVAGVIEPTLQAAEVQRSSRRPVKDMGAYDLYLRAYAMMLSPARRVAEVAGLLDQAIACDPDFGPALGLAAAYHMNSHIFHWSEDLEDNRRQGLECGRRALLVAGDDPTILVNAAFALGYFGEDINTMIAMVDRALALNPSSARGWHASGTLRLWAGQLDLAIEHERTSLRLSPRTRVGWALNVIGHADFFGRRFEEAIETLLLAIQEDPNAVAYRVSSPATPIWDGWRRLGRR